MRRGFLTGFTGSAGTALITAHDAHLWTDSRYWNEASSCLDGDHWTLKKQGAPGTKTIPKWLGDMAVKHYQEQKKPLKVGMDPYVHAASFAKELQDAFKEAAAEELSNDDDNESVQIGVLDTSNENLIDPIWGTDRPPVPTSRFRVHPLEYAGISVADKIAKIRKEMKTKKASLAVFCTLDDVAYLLNMRSKGDIATCPVGIAYATISMDEVTLYCNDEKVQDPAVQEHLKEVTIKSYDDVVADIKTHCEKKGHKVWLDKSRAIFALSNVIPDKCLVDAQNAVTPMKACKNQAEMQGMRQAHIVDGVAMANFMAWLEKTIVQEGRAVSEVEIDEKLTGFRAEQPGFQELSFPTIAGVGPNGAIIHYRASADSGIMRYLDTENPILIDSGGQYNYGTTDVTRTWHFGTPTPEFVDCYTRVLKGNIGLDEMIFPENTPGFALDIYARRWLWDAGKDYGHGTGHGVGAALNVHEGPQGISPRWNNKEVLKKGMVLSNEPGFYDDGNFGIRIENLMEVSYVKPEFNVEESEDDDAPKSTEKKFLKFIKMTMIPIQKNLIDLDLMTKVELDWLDAYHQQVLEKISPLLEADSPAMAWLQKSCEKIDRN
jgi:Xaa-Pro aminopeptidase